MQDQRERIIGRPGTDRRSSPDPSSESRAAAVSATTTTIGCCARPRSSTTTASAPSASGIQLSEAAAADLLAELLPLVDDLERALKADAGARERRGDPPRRRADSQSAAGRAAEARRHADRRRSARISIRTSTRRSRTSRADGRRDGEVTEEFRRGYMLGDRLLRPAMVKVAKG